jgi:hypothetical protein
LGIGWTPIGVLPTRHKGWRDLTVLAAGGGIMQAYTAVVPFRGRRYASNPTTAPAYELPKSLKPRILIPRDDKGYLLFPGRPWKPPPCMADAPKLSAAFPPPARTSAAQDRTAERHRSG